MTETLLALIQSQAAAEIRATGSVALETQRELHAAIAAKPTPDYVAVAGL